MNDRIEVLPLSSFDDRIRLELFRSLYRDSALHTYRLTRVQPPIRILVNHGNVTLTGTFDSEMDRNVVYERNGGRGRTRTCDLLRVKQAL